jgi:hydrogenase 3 maturation protease
MVNILLGIGNPLRRDDGVGNYVALNFRRQGWISLDCGTVPENFTGIVRREHPSLLVLVDAADMGLSPGEFRVVPGERIRDVSFGTHQLPLDILAGYLEASAGKIVIVGIQPAIVETGEGLSPPVRQGADRLIRCLEREESGKIPVFC